MPRPNYPQPPCILTSGVISRLISDQANYDEDPDSAEREQEDHERYRKEQQEEEERQQREQDQEEGYMYG